MRPNHAVVDEEQRCQPTELTALGGNGIWRVASGVKIFRLSEVIRQDCIGNETPLAAF